VIRRRTQEEDMSITQLTESNIAETIANNDIVIIDFWASWCGPCQAFKPIFEAAAEQHADVAFASCNTEEEQNLAGAFQIRSIPTIMVFREQIPVFAQPGMLPAGALDELIGKVKDLDMDEVRKTIEERAAATA
jgi:thioredoxin 1